MSGIDLQEDDLGDFCPKLAKALNIKLDKLMPIRSTMPPSTTKLEEQPFSLKKKKTFQYCNVRQSMRRFVTSKTDHFDSEGMI